jgi:hypothetical protein
MTEQACQVPENTLDNFKDFLGKYTIVLNGTVIEKRLDQPEELSFENKREVFEKFERLVLADRRRILEEVEKTLKTPEFAYCVNCQKALAKLAELKDGL